MLRKAMTPTTTMLVALAIAAILFLIMMSIYGSFFDIDVPLPFG